MKNKGAEPFDRLRASIAPNRATHRNAAYFAGGAASIFSTVSAEPSTEPVTVTM